MSKHDNKQADTKKEPKQSSQSWEKTISSPEFKEVVHTFKAEGEKVTVENPSDFLEEVKERSSNAIER